MTRYSERAECRVLFRDLLALGVTAEYLVNYGVSKETVANILADLGKRVPPHLWPLVRRRASGDLRKNDGTNPTQPKSAPTVTRSNPHGIQSSRPVLPAYTTSLNPLTTPFQPQAINSHGLATSYEVFSPMEMSAAEVNAAWQAGNGPSAEEPIQPEEAARLAAIEAKRREVLKARKSDIATRNAARAKKVELDIDGLFAAATSSVNTPMVIDLESQNEASIADLRRVIEASDETSTFPSNGPFSASASSSGIAPASAGNNASPHQSRRPKATDFEAEPSHALPQHPRRSGVFVPDSSWQRAVIIEISDNDEDDAESSRGKRAKVSPSPSVAESLSAGITTTSATAVQTSGEDDERQKELEAKEREIKKMMDMIARMEGRKKKAVKAEPTSNRSTPSATPLPLPSIDTDTHLRSSALAPQTSGIDSPMASAVLAEAKSQVAQLVEERDDMIATSPDIYSAIPASAIRNDDVEMQDASPQAPLDQEAGSSSKGIATSAAYR